MHTVIWAAVSVHGGDRESVCRAQRGRGRARARARAAARSAAVTRAQTRHMQIPLTNVMVAIDLENMFNDGVSTVTPWLMSSCGMGSSRHLRGTFWRHNQMTVYP